jgi:hypothetical protein
MTCDVTIFNKMLPTLETDPEIADTKAPIEAREI